MTESLWPKLKDALDRRSTEDVVVSVMGATESERKAAFPELATYLKGGQSGWSQDWREVGVLGLAVLGCAPTAKRTLSILHQASLRWWRSAIPADRAVEVLLYRAVPWLPDLATGLAERLGREASVSDWLFADAIVRAAAIAPPLTEGFTSGWVSWVRAQPDPDAAIAQGAYAHYLLPMLFEHDRLGRTLEFTFQARGFNGALVRLARTDPEVGVLVLNGCLARLLRGGRPGDLRAYVALHEEMAPTAAEIAERCTDYVGLLCADLGTVAGFAQRCLRRAEEAGLIAPDTVLDASAIVLARKEKKLLTTQATWVRQAARRHPSHRAELLALLDSPVKPASLPELVDYGVPVVPELGAPIASPVELAEELAALVEGDWSVPTVERVLDGLIRLRTHESFEAALEPFVRSDSSVLSGRWLPSPWNLLGASLTALLGGERSRRDRLTDAFLDWVGGHSVYKPLTKTNRSPQTLLEIRIHAIMDYPGHRVPRLVATPTLRNGLIDPAVLMDRLEAAEREGWQPWDIDLAQALLRLPRDVDAAVVRRAHGLASPAGIALAHRLRDGHPDPIATRHFQSRRIVAGPDWGTPDRRAVVALAPTAALGVVEAAMFTLNPPPGPVQGPFMETGPAAWSAALPAHREVVAAWALPQLACLADAEGRIRGTAAMLPLLAEAQGPVGPATALALAYGLAARDASDRVAAVDAVLALFSTVDFGLVGAEIGSGVADGRLTLKRAASALHDAAEAGAVEAVWHACLGMLPEILRAPKPWPGTADVLHLAARCTRSLGRRAQIEGLAAFADRGGGSQAVAAARDLRDALAS
jgi:hypothetical protein